jgi:hypothetical protein
LGTPGLLHMEQRPGGGLEMAELSPVTTCSCSMRTGAGGGASLTLPCAMTLACASRAERRGARDAAAQARISQTCSDAAAPLKLKSAARCGASETFYLSPARGARHRLGQPIQRRGLDAACIRSTPRVAWRRGKPLSLARQHAAFEHARIGSVSTTPSAPTRQGRCMTAAALAVSVREGRRERGP